MANNHRYLLKPITDSLTLKGPFNVIALVSQFAGDVDFLILMVFISKILVLNILQL